MKHQIQSIKQYSLYSRTINFLKIIDKSNIIYNRYY